MAVDYIKDIVAADRYVGNAGIGGSLDGVIQIDTKPLEQLAAYTVMYKKSVWEQNQKDAEEQAKQLATLTAYDLNSSIPKDSKEIQKQWQDLYAYVQKNPNVLDYKNNPQGFLEYNKKKSEFEDNLSGAKTRSILYDVRKKEIASITNTQLKKLNETELNNDANSTDLRTPLPYAQKYNDTLPEMPKATGKKVPVTKRNPNDIFDEEHELWDKDSAQAKSNVFSMGLNEVIDESTPEGKRKAIARKSNFWIDGADVFNNAVASYKDENGNVDVSKIKGISKDMVALAEKLNAYSAEKNIEIESGVYGKLLTSYPTINWKDGISSDELALMADFASWGGDKVTRKIVETNDATEAQRLVLEQRGQNLTYAVGMARIKQDKAELDAKQKQWKATQFGSQTQVNGAMERAKRIYSDLNKLADDKGVISPDKLRRLNTEQLKYLGIEKPITDVRGKATGNPILQPLSLEGQEHALELVNGEVRVLKPKNGKTTLDKTKSGNFEGLFDNSKSTNLFNIATNILNEELTKAGTKELNNYWGLDVTGGNTSFIDTNNTQQSGSYSSSNATVPTNSFTEDQLKKGASKYKMSLSEYKKSIGL